MPTNSPTAAANSALVDNILAAFDRIAGLHPGFRPVHAKGVMCTGTFTPTPAAANLTRAPHASRPSTRVVVRFSLSAGVPTTPDNDPQGGGPRGMAIRFYLADHVHTDIVTHSADSFPTRTPEEFLELLRAAGASGPDVTRPTPIEQFLATHPSALHHVQLPKPFPTSFTRDNYFAVSAMRFTNAAGAIRHGRIRILPVGGTEFLSADEAAKQSPNYLVDEIGPRLAASPAKFQIFVQLAADGDELADATIRWPESREKIEFGTITLTERVNELDPEMRKLIFDPIPRVDGIDPAGDPLFAVRGDIYLTSGRRRRAATT